MADRKSYQRQYYRKQAMNSMRRTIKNLKALRKQFLESPEGIAYKKRLREDYAKKYRHARCYPLHTNDTWELIGICIGGHTINIP